MSSGKWRPSCLGLNVLTPWCAGVFSFNKKQQNENKELIITMQIWYYQTQSDAQNLVCYNSDQNSDQMHISEKTEAGQLKVNQSKRIPVSVCGIMGLSSWSNLSRRSVGGQSQHLIFMGQCGFISKQWVWRRGGENKP